MTRILFRLMVLGLLSSPSAFATAADWRFTDGSEFPGAKGELATDDSGVMRLKYDFSGGGNYVGAWRDLDPPPELIGISFRVKKPPETRLTLRVVDSTGQGLQEPFFFDHPDWQPIEIDMLNFDAHWGGAGDGILHPPVKGIGILVESRELGEPTGEVLLADVELKTGQESQESRGSLRTTYAVTDFRNGRPFSGPIQGGRVTAAFDATDSVAIGNSLSIYGRPSAFTLNIRGGKAGNVVRLQLGSHFQTFSRLLGTLDGGEKTFTVPAPPEGWNFGGGENNGEVRLPLRLNAIVLERGEAPKEPTEIALLSLEADTVVSAGEVIAGAAAFASPVGEEFSETPIGTGFTLAAVNLREAPVTGKLGFTLRDWQGNTLRSGYRDCTLPPRGQPWLHAVKVETPGHVFLEGQFQFEAPEGAFTTRACFARTVEGNGDPALTPESPWGMGVYLYRYGDDEAGHAQMDKAASLAQAAGVKWSREEFSWARTEPRQGEFDFGFYDTVVDTARRHGISVYGLLSYWSDWTEPYTEKGIDDFCVWAKAVVGHFKDRVKHWEVYNEPNIFFWQGPKELYPLLVKKCHAAIKEADPEAQVLAVSTSGIDTKFIQLCLDAGAPFDVLTVHPYRPYLSERVFMEDLRNAAKQVGGRPLWITEMGWSTNAGGIDERAQAELLARCYLGAVASGACQNVSWYDFRNDGDDPLYNESNFGVLRGDLSPKPAYRALATVCRTMAHGQPKLRDDFPRGIYALGMGNATAVWSPARTFKVPMRLAADAKVVNLMGEAVSPERDGDIAVLELNAGAPLFVTGGQVTPAGEPTEMEETRHHPVLRF